MTGETMSSLLPPEDGQLHYQQVSLSVIFHHCLTMISPDFNRSTTPDRIYYLPNIGMLSAASHSLISWSMW